jgi:hypothetical protein
MIKCTSHLFDENHQMIKEIFNAYAGSNGQCFTLNPNDDLPNEAELVISKSKQIVYIAWKLDHCIALEVVSKNANEDKFEQHFDVIISCENSYMSDIECKEWLDNVSEKAVASTKEKIQTDVNSKLVIHSEVHTVYPNSVISFSESKAKKSSLADNRKVIFEWAEKHFLMCLSIQQRKAH